MKKYLLPVGIMVLTLSWMLVIFGFSAQSGTESSGLSAVLSKPLTRLVMRFVDDSSSEAEVYLQVDLVVRKVAHFTEYAILGTLLTLLFRCIRVRKLYLPVLIGALYAVTDEWHQSFSPGRVSAGIDVLIDTCGVLAGALLCTAILHIWRKKHVHDQ